MVMRKVLFERILILAVLVGLTSLTTSCSSIPDSVPSGLTKSSTGTNAGGPDHPAANQRFYRLGIGDKLKITVFGEDALSGEFEVGARGTVSLPLVGDIDSQGLSLPQFRDRMAKRLSEGYLKDPRITVEVLNYRGFFVHGEVRNGGEFKYKNGLKIRDAIAMAGGFSYRANESYFYLMRENYSKPVKVPLPNNMPVLPGDNIRVPERFF